MSIATTINHLDEALRVIESTSHDYSFRIMSPVRDSFLSPEQFADYLEQSFGPHVFGYTAFVKWKRQRKHWKPQLLDTIGTLYVPGIRQHWVIEYYPERYRLTPRQWEAENTYTDPNIETVPTQVQRRQ